MSAEQSLLELTSYCQIQQMFFGTNGNSHVIQKVSSLADHALTCYKFAIESEDGCYMLVCANTLLNALNLIKNSPSFQEYSELFSLAEKAYKDSLRPILNCNDSCSCRQKDVAIAMSNSLAL